MKKADAIEYNQTVHFGLGIGRFELNQLAPTDSTCQRNTENN